MRDATSFKLKPAIGLFPKNDTFKTKRDSNEGNHVFEERRDGNPFRFDRSENLDAPLTMLNLGDGQTSNFRDPSCPVVQTMSRHLLQQDLLRQAVEPFEGSPLRFWPWVGKLQSFLGELKLSPFQFLQVMQAHSGGEPRVLISDHLSSIGFVTETEVADLWEILKSRYGSPHQIADELTQKMENFPTIKGPGIGNQLNNMYSLCKMIQYHGLHCPELGILNYARGLGILRKKLPEFLQNDWRKFGQAYEDTHGAGHPPFSKFVEFIRSKARQLSNKNYETIRDSSVNRVRVLQTDVLDNRGTASPQVEPISDIPEYCSIHDSNDHSIRECGDLKKLPWNERKRRVYEMKLCFVCLGNHMAQRIV